MGYFTGHMVMPHSVSGEPHDRKASDTDGGMVRRYFASIRVHLWLNLPFKPRLAPGIAPVAPARFPFP